MSQYYKLIILAIIGVVMVYGDCRAGNLAIKYETGGVGVSYISHGDKWGDPGGVSYGSYQLETNKGTMQAYLSNNNKYTAQLKQFKINSAAFKQKWKELAKEDPDGFQQSQFDFLASKANGYYDAMAYAENLGWTVDNVAMQSAIFSTSNQSGHWKIIFNDADIGKTDSIEVQINKLYDARARYFRNLHSLPTTVKKNIIKNRTVDERKDCLKLIEK